MPTPRAADASPTCRRRVSDASPAHRQCLALDAPLLSSSSTSSHPKRHVIQPTRRIARRRNADASPKPRKRVADATPTRRHCVAEMLPTRRRCVTDATLTHRQRLALQAPLLALTSTSFPHFAIQPTRRFPRRRYALPTRRRYDIASPTRRRCVAHVSSTHSQRLALRAPLLGMSSTSVAHLAIHSTRRVACRRDAAASPIRRRRVAVRGGADASRRRRSADSTLTRRRHDAVPTCRRRNVNALLMTHRRCIADASPMRTQRVADASPTRRRCVTEASPTHRQRLALDAPLL